VVGVGRGPHTRLKAMLQADAAVRWVLGVSLCFLNSLLSSVGFIMQRRAHLLEEQQALVPDSRISPKPLLYVGICIYIVAAVPDVLAYMLVPQVLTVLAHLFLQERIHGREIVGMALCTLGTAACVYFGPRPVSSSEATADKFFHPQVTAYLVVGLSILAILLFVEHVEALPCCRKSVPENVFLFTLPMATGLAYAFEKVFNTQIGFLEQPERLPLGLLEAPQWTSMLVAIGALGLLDFYLNLRGAKRMPVQVFAPLAFALCTSLQYFQSVVVFGELQDLPPVNATISVLGACISLVGALVIRPPRLWLLGRELVDDEEIDKNDKQEKVGQGGTASSNPMLVRSPGTGGDALDSEMSSNYTE